MTRLLFALLTLLFLSGPAIGPAMTMHAMADDPRLPGYRIWPAVSVR
jgi:hypothetical protein